MGFPELPFGVPATKKDDLGVVVHAKLMVSGPFPCRIVLRADCD